MSVANIWTFALRGILPKVQQRTFNLLFGTISNLFSKSFTTAKLEYLDGKMKLALALLERDFPAALFNITTHISHHFVEKIKRFGPLYSSWMYPLERMNSWISRRCTSKNDNLERTVMETYQV